MKWVWLRKIFVIGSITPMSFVISCNEDNNENPKPNPKPENPMPPTNNLIDKEKQKWNNYVFSEHQFTNEQLNQFQLEIEFICEQANLLDIDNFAYQFNLIERTDSIIYFSVTISPDDITQQDFIIKKEVPYKLINHEQNDLINIVNKLNNINWNDFDYAKLFNNKLNFWNLSNIGHENGYVLNYIKNFNANKFITDNNLTSLSINENSFKLNVLKLNLKFKITVVKGNNQLDTNEVSINFKTPKEYLSVLDGDDNIDSSIKILNSSKGLLTILEKPLNTLSESLFTSRYNKFFNTPSNEMNKQFKYLEMLYQARFMFYQSFGDNASSIDYGIENNQVVFKAKIANNTTISKPYIQVIGDENNISSINLNKNDVLTIRLTPSNINDSWIPMNNDDDIFPGLSSQFLYGRGPEKDSILSGPTIKSFGQNQKSWNISITINNMNITNKSINWRVPFCFVIPCIKR